MVSVNDDVLAVDDAAAIYLNGTEIHRHNLPEWLVQPLKDQLGDGFWPLTESLNAGAGLDLRGARYCGG